MNRLFSLIQLINEIDHALQFSITVELQSSMSEITNYDQVKDSIVAALINLRDTPNRLETPSIYHLDVAAMYPNIILTNRLQPDAIVNEDICATCDFNEGPESECQRTMTWSWRGDFFTAKKGEYNMIRNQLEQEKFPGKYPSAPQQSFHELSKADQTVLINKRIGEYSRKIYGKGHETKVVEKESVVCQRENPFYVDTVRDFRDRRYEYKALLKQWKKKLESANADGDATGMNEAEKLIVIYDSLQLAHKCILNSFYGYVMRKGARWYSMEMAGIVCLTGAKIIQLARTRVEKVGRPLELDTDGIWCMLPASFPENFAFTLKNGKSLPISYPCVMLNHLVHDQFTNHQYQELTDPATMTYSTRKENSIFFEVDGPYRAMILPSSTEEDKLLKKRYAVFNHDGTLAELKGFEVKRRGELKLVKNFQSNIFKVFLEGTTLEECYAAVATAANRWLDILHTKGAGLSDEELFDLVSENRSMSKSLEGYGNQKSTSITTAKRLAEFLGDQMVQDKGLNCKFIIACKPFGLPVSERAIPVTIFLTDSTVKKHFLRKWLKDNSLQDVNIRDIIDWQYYLERFGSVIQKLVTIPAAMQNVENPIPRVSHPDWLQKRLFNRDDKSKQFRITELFKPAETKAAAIEEAPSTAIRDMEDIGQAPPKLINGKRRFGMAIVNRKSRKPKKIIKKKIPEGTINPFEDYSGWVGQQRSNWRELVRKRSAAHIQKSGTGITSFFPSSACNMRENMWQLLDIAETDTSGIFRIWAIVDGVLESAMFEVPRTFYINSRITNAGSAINRAEIQMTSRVRTLPRNRPMCHLYELRMSETFYRSHSAIFSSICNHKDIEGVYERQVTPLFRALLSLGCFGQLRNFGLVDNLPPILELEDMKRVHKPTSQYLGVDMLQTVHLFRAKSGTKQLWGLFDTFSAKIHVTLVDPGLNRDALPHFKRLYEEAWTKKNEDGPDAASNSYPNEVDIKSQIVESEKEVIRDFNKILQIIKDEGNRPIVIGVQVTGGQKHLRSIGLDAIREFPNMQIPSHKADSQLPALGWQSYTAKRMMGHFMNLSDFVTDRIELCRYADIPLCNVENDYTLFLSDLFLSRRLVKQDMLLWCSASSKPDLGGSEQDDNRVSLDEFQNPEINNPGTFENICVEIDVWDLALNTLIQSFGNSSDMDDNMGSSSRGNIHLLNNHFAEGEQNSSLSFSGGNDSLHFALGIIRSMVRGWLDQVRAQNKFASHLLEHFHRWITSTAASLYDPLIVAYIHNLMKRSFAYLLEELKRMGSELVFASFDKLVLSTSKTSMKTAGGYVTYLLAAIGKNPQFEHLELKPVNFWDYLLWIDVSNYGGILFVENADPDILGDVNGIVDMKWTMAEYLPPAVQNAFLQVVAEYIHKVQLLKAGSNTNINTTLSDVLSSEISDRLYQLVMDIHKRRLIGSDDGAEDQLVFPAHPGSCRVMTNPALELITMITTILELNNHLGRAVRIVKGNLLRLIGVKEFSTEAVFRNPCEKYTLPQVICEYCNYCCDLDLTRNADQLDEQDTDEDKFLECNGCSTAYDREGIEQRLVENVQLMICKWQLQDLKCSACRLVKAEELRNTCASCTGKLTTVLSLNTCESQLKVLGNLARYFKMDTLQEVITFACA